MHVKRYMSLNSSWGVTTDFVDRMMDEEIQSALADLYVLKAYCLIGKRVDKPFPLCITFLTFEVPT
jgi:hypothetical protein